MFLKQADLINKLSKHIVDQAPNVVITSTSTNKFKIEVKETNKFNFSYFIMIAEITFTEEGPTFHFVHSNTTDTATRIMKALTTFDPTK